MKGDFSRNPLSPFADLTRPRTPDLRVLMQQGRVQLDADWNEQVALLLYYLQALAADLIGPYGGPSENYGFEISIPEGKLTDLQFSKGRYYVDGILCEHNPDDAADAVKYYEQPNYPLNETTDPLPNPPFLVYLDVWERHVTCLEAPNIHEIALGEADTTTRAQVVWQVKICPKSETQRAENSVTISDLTPSNLNQRWPGLLPILKGENHGQLSAWTVEPGEEDSLHPCLTAPEARYRGQENRLYRVEIHQGGAAYNGGNKEKSATFKWSRDNGSVVASCLKLEGAELTADQARGFAAGQWVEVSDDDRDLRGEPGLMVKVLKVEGEALTIDPLQGVADIVVDRPNKHPKVRRWDHFEIKPGQSVTGQTVEKWSDGALLVTEDKDGEILLEDGVKIRFEQVEAAYRTGDYWLIPARTASGDVEWPNGTDGKAKFLPPHGITHHYAPLAVVKGTEENDVVDLRREFAPAVTSLYQ